MGRLDLRMISDNGASDGQALVWDDTSGLWLPTGVVNSLNGDTGALFAYTTVEDEGSALTQRPTLDFEGAGVEVTDDAANNKTIVTIPGAGGSGSGGGLLAITRYRPSANTVLATTSATPADVSTANLAVTFTAPASGQVLVDLNAAADFTAATATAYMWCLRNSSGLIAGTDNVALRGSSSRNTIRVHMPIFVTGLTSGSSYTWTWAHKLDVNDAGATARLLVGNTVGTAIWGDALMTVREA